MIPEDKALPSRPIGKTKSDFTRFTRRYIEALQGHLAGPANEAFPPPGQLGAEAMVCQFDMFDLAKIHQSALLELLLQSDSALIKAGTIKRAQTFFISVLAPIKRKQRAAVKFELLRTKMRTTLTEKKRELATANRSLKIEKLRRSAVERILVGSEAGLLEATKKAKEIQEQSRNLTHHVLMAQEAERLKISRELHDEVAQVLAGINFHLATLKKEAQLSMVHINRKIASTQRLVEKSVDIVHHFARQLRPPFLDDLGLIPALRSFLKEFTKKTGLRVRLAAFAGVEELDREKRTVLFRVAQEALTNVGLHADASQVNVTIRAVEKFVEMEITDDGKSFQVDRVLFARRNRRLGLLGMRERVEMVGGSFFIESLEGVGTTVRIKILFKKRRAQGPKPEPAKSQT